MTAPAGGPQPGAGGLEPDAGGPEPERSWQALDPAARKRIRTQLLLVVGPILLLLLGLTLGTYAWARWLARREYVQERFLPESQSAAARLTNYLQTRLVFLEDLAHVLELSGTPSAASFRAFATPERNRVAGIQALEWAPRVQAAGRASVEADLGRSGVGPSPITEQGPDRLRRPAGARPHYYPVVFLEPLAGNEQALGFDLASEASRRAAIDRAVATGLPAATEPVRLVQETQTQAGFLVFLPVYAQGRPLDTPGQRQAAVRGVVLAVFRTGDLLAAALGPVRDPSLRIALRDAGATHGSGPFHVWGGAGGGPAPDLGLPGAGRPFQLQIPVAGRTWVADIEATPAFLAVNLQGFPLLVLLGGLGLSALLAAVLALLVTAKARAERLFQARNQELIVSHARLRDREEDLRLLLDSTGGPLYGIDREGRCTFCNRAFLEATGFADLGQVLGRNMHQLIHHSSIDGAPMAEPACRIYQAFRSGQGTHVEDEVFWRADGTAFPVEYWSFPWRRDGKVIGAVITFADITERQALERLAADRGRLLEAVGRALVDLLDPSRDRPDLEALLKRVGSGARAGRAFLLEAADEPETRFELRHAWRADGTEPRREPLDFREAGLERWLELLRRGQQVSGAAAEFPAGERAVMERLGMQSVVLMPVLVRGRLHSVMGFQEAFGLRAWTRAEQDVLRLTARALGAVLERGLGLAELTEIRAGLQERIDLRTLELTQANASLQKEAAVRQEAERRLLALTGGLLRLGPDPAANLATLTGLAADLTGAERADYLARRGIGLAPAWSFPEGAGPVPPALLGLDPATLAGPEPVLLEGGADGSSLVQPVRHREGWEGLLAVTRAPGRSWSREDHQALGMLAAAAGIEVSRRRLQEANQRAQAQLGQVQKLESVGRLAAGIAHEINTPIQFLGVNLRFLQKAFGQMLAAPPSDGQLVQPPGRPAWIQDEVPKVLDESLHGLDRVVEILQGMKEFSHPGGTAAEPVDLNHCLQSVVAVARNEWTCVARLTLALDPGLPPILGFPAELSQAFLNLLVNAAHAVAAARRGGDGLGAITVASAAIPGGVEVRVGDTGTGIAPEHQARVFEPFFTTKAVAAGTGQGLALCQHTVVTRHGGRIAFRTEPGRGTTFVVQLPLQPHQPDFGAPDPDPAP